MKAIRPLAEDGDTVLLRPADYEVLVRQAEDAACRSTRRSEELRRQKRSRDFAF